MSLALNTSATGGPLLPMASPPAPLVMDDNQLIVFFQQLFVGIVGTIPGNEFYPRWQPDVANLPEFGENFASLGIESGDPPLFSYQVHVPAVAATETSPGFPAYNVYQAHEELEILVSFYGPLAKANAAILRDGLQVSQNRESLLLAGMGVVGTGRIVTVPALVKTRWLRRYDLPVTIRREIVRWYPILDVASACIAIDVDGQFTTKVGVSP